MIELGDDWFTRAGTAMSVFRRLCRWPGCLPPGHQQAAKSDKPWTRLVRQRTWRGLIPAILPYREVVCR
jgi:hypothetical protein